MAAKNPPRARARALPAALARVPYGVVRPQDASAIYADPRGEFRRMAAGGQLRRLATGYYAVVPSRATDQVWLPSIEAAAYGIAAATSGPDSAVLMGLSAARLHGAVPRALGVAVVAVPRQRPVVHLLDRDGSVHFVRRRTGDLQADRVSTDLGTALVTSIEQTLLDLAHRPALGGVEVESREAVRTLWERADGANLAELAAEQRLAASLARARQWVHG